MIPSILQAARNLVQATVYKGCLGTMRKARRGVALVLVGLLLHSSGAGLFQALHAETAGATAPEVTKFEPVNTTDLVNLASGDFSYTIPVINVPGPEGGYPLALGYHAGIQHGEEASWVGLGWNLQPGSISRAVKGYPDDFNGVGINTNYLSNVYETYSVGVNFCFVEAGVSYTTYKGFSGYVGITFETGYSLGAASAQAGVALRVNFSSEGVGFTASADANASLGPYSVGVSANTDFKHGVETERHIGVSLGGFSHSEGRDSKGGKTSSSGVGPASFSSYSGGGNHRDTIGIGFSLFGAIGFKVSYTRSWIDKKEFERAFGYYYHTAAQNNTGDTEDPDFVNSHHTREDNRIDEWTMESDPTVVPGDSKEHALAAGLHYLASNDGYAVIGEGTGGSLKLTRLQDRIYRPRRVKTDEWNEGRDWPYTGDSTLYAPRFVFDGDNTETISNPNGIGLKKEDLRTQLDALVPYPATSTSKISQADFDSIATQSLLGKSFLPGSRVVKETLNPDGSGLFSAFNVWEADGKHYTYGEPIYNLNSETISANRPTIGTGEWFRSKSTITQKYAYAWYLTELRYPDYWDVSGNGLSEDDHGGWVRFTYIATSSDYRWHTSSDGQLNDGPLNRVDKLGKDKAGMMYSMQYGAKELKYLNMIETATHKAIFVTSPRADGIEVQNAGAKRTGNVKLIDNHDGTYDLEVKETLPGALTGSLKINFPGLADGAIKSWSNLSNTPTPYGGGSCDRNSLDANVGTDTAVFSQQCNINIAGIPLTVASLTRGYSEMEETIQDPGDGQFCSYLYTYSIRQTDYTYHAKLIVKIDDPASPANNQFWANPSPVSNAFQSIRARWTALLATAAASAGLVSLGPNAMQKLDDIYLIEKSTGALVKQVHFFYSYRLAQSTAINGAPFNGTPNTDRVSRDSQGRLINPNGGKLTLEAIQTYGQGGSAELGATLPPYRFEYGSNPGWGTKYCFDRWGFFKSDGGPWNHRDVNGADQAAWSLTKIILPTGGTLQIQYEPKDYTRVQDRVPINPLANGGQVSQYLVDLDPWIGTGDPANSTAWPVSDQEWASFKDRVNGVGGTPPQPFHLFTPLGTTNPDGTPGIYRAQSTLEIQNTIPIESAPNPKDLKLWLAKTQAPTSIYKKRQDQAQLFANLSMDNAIETPAKVAAQGSSIAPVERMVNIVFEYWTGGNRAQKLLGRPHKLMTNDDVAGFTDDDRGDRIVKSALVRMVRRMDAIGGADMFITDPTFDWPKEAPNSMYVTWTANPTQAKIGGGVRVKRVLSFDGQRSYNTSYTYTDYVDGAWISSGVAAQEPPPFGYSAADDRVIYTEKGGWANEGGGGIYHSRVVVRHSWSEDPAPSGSTMNGGGTASSPMGESVFRFISPRDLPHQQRDVDDAKTFTDTTGNIYTNSARITEIFNVGSWWGQLLWKEDRDSTGHPLNRVENRYTQLEGYLRLFDGIGYDLDVEKVWGGAPRPSDMGYHWADNQTTFLGDSTPAPNLPILINKTTGPTGNKVRMGQDFVSTVGVDPINSDTFRGYLNASVNVTLISESLNTFRHVNVHPPKLYWKTKTTGPDLPLETDGDYTEDLNPPSGWHSSVVGVREISFAPLVSEIRTYGEGQKLLGVTRNTKWDRRTGAVMEREERGRRTQAVTDPAFESDLKDPFRFHDRTVTRTWPAYWQYDGVDGMDKGVDSTGLPGPATSIRHMLTQVAQTTTLRKKADGSSIFLNSKVDTWWQPEQGAKSGRWAKGGEFVWNGLGAGSTPSSFPGFALPNQWTPDSIPSTGVQRYKSSDNWITAGATTKYDAFAHALEAVDGDGVYGCSKYGYPYDNNGNSLLPAGNLPIAKFANAQDAETLYWNFEGNNTNNGTGGPLGGPPNTSEDPLIRLNTAYTGERAYSGTLPIPIPTQTQTDGYELRYFVKAADQATALASCQTAVSWKQAVPAERDWWFVRTRAASGSVQLSGTFDDVSVFPWRKKGAPCSVSHYAYDRTLGLVTSITGSNGRTTRYKYDHLGRLKMVYDVYGKPTAATKYGHVTPLTVPGFP